MFLVEERVEAVESVQARGLVLGITEKELKCVVGSFTGPNTHSVGLMKFDFIFLDNHAFESAIGSLDVGRMLKDEGGYVGATLLPCDTHVTRAREAAVTLVELLPDVAHAFVVDPYIRLGNNGFGFHHLHSHAVFERMGGELRWLLSSLNTVVEDLWGDTMSHSSPAAADMSHSSPAAAINSVGSLLIQLRGLCCTSLPHLRKKAAASALAVSSLHVGGASGESSAVVLEHELCSEGDSCDEEIDFWELKALLGLTPGFSVPVYLIRLRGG